MRGTSEKLHLPEAKFYLSWAIGQWLTLSPDLYTWLIILIPLIYFYPVALYRCGTLLAYNQILDWFTGALAWMGYDIQTKYSRETERVGFRSSEIQSQCRFSHSEVQAIWIQYFPSSLSVRLSVFLSLFSLFICLTLSLSLSLSRSLSFPSSLFHIVEFEAVKGHQYRSISSRILLIGWYLRVMVRRYARRKGTT